MFQEVRSSISDKAARVEATALTLSFCLAIMSFLKAALESNRATLCAHCVLTSPPSISGEDPIHSARLAS